MSDKEKKIRRDKIIELVKHNSIRTQAELSKKLIELGFNITQATVSRDIKKLNLIKKRVNNEMIYAILEVADDSKKDLISVMSSLIIKIDIGLNILVVKTKAGMSHACCIAIEDLKLDEIIGTLAGEDTIIIVTKNEDKANLLLHKLKAYTGLV